MDLFPAIDLRGGQAVRLLRGDYAQEVVYDADPVARAEAFIASDERHWDALDGATLASLTIR